jgi:hypothetical protein
MSCLRDIISDLRAKEKKNLNTCATTVDMRCYAVRSARNRARKESIDVPLIYFFYRLDESMACERKKKRCDPEQMDFVISFHGCHDEGVWYEYKVLHRATQCDTVTAIPRATCRVSERREGRRVL